MNELVCKSEYCIETVMCDENVVAVTCYLCCATLGMCQEDE